MPAISHLSRRGGKLTVSPLTFPSPRQHFIDLSDFLVGHAGVGVRMKRQTVLRIKENPESAYERVGRWDG